MLIRLAVPHLIGLCPVGTDGGISSRKMCGLGLWIYWIWMEIHLVDSYTHTHTHIYIYIIYIKDVHACAYSISRKQMEPCLQTFANGRPTKLASFA